MHIKLGSLLSSMTKAETDKMKNDIDEFLMSVDMKKIIKEVTCTSTNGAEVDDGPATWYRSFAEYEKDVVNKAEGCGWMILDYLITGADPIKFGKTPGGDRPITYFPKGIHTGNNVNSYKDLKGYPATKEWLSNVKRLAQVIGWKFLEWSAEIDSVKKGS